MTKAIPSYSLSDAGNKRDNNEDAYLSSGNIGLWAIADGMGGHEAGEVASAVTLKTFQSQVEAGQSLESATQAAHQAVLDAVDDSVGAEGMGSTLVGLSSDDTTWKIVWVGDSRGYQWNKSSGLTPRTRDQSLVQQLVDKGVITEEEARVHPNRNVIIQALGQLDLEKPVVDTSSHDYEDGDMLLLCSDGLSDCVEDEAINEIITAADNPEEAASNLVSRALENGGKDNITVIIVCLDRNNQKDVEMVCKKSFFQKLKKLEC